MARKRDGLKQPGDAGSGLSKVQVQPKAYYRVLHITDVRTYCEVTLCAPHADCDQRCSCRPRSSSPLQALGVRCSMPDWLLDELAATVVRHTGLELKGSHPGVT